MNPVRLLSGALVASLVLFASARGETALFLMSGPGYDRGWKVHEAYVVGVNDPALAEQARTHLAAGRQKTHLVPIVRIASGPSEENVNYAEPGRPSWGWHATELIAWLEWDPTAARTLEYLAERDSAPSGVHALLHEGVSGMYLVDFPLVMELSPSKPGGVSNLSTRGWVGAGERVLIGGFVVTGGTPRNLLIRGLGPSLAQYGIQEPLTDPTLTVFSGSTEIAANDDWKSGNLHAYLTERGWITVVPHPIEWMLPGDPREPALLVSLPPGAYTVHLGGAGSDTGIALVELYDLNVDKTP